jgi:hypothetical protein
MRDFIVADDADLSHFDSQESGEGDSKKNLMRKKRKKRRKSPQHSLEEEDKQFMTSMA